MMQHPFSANGIELRWKSTNRPCFLTATIRNLHPMIQRRAVSAEQGAWRDVSGGWRPLYGDVEQLGVGVEWHDFHTERLLDWGRSFHPRSVEFCLNLGGHGTVG